MGSGSRDSLYAHQVSSKFGAKLYLCRRFRRVPDKIPRIAPELAIAHCRGECSKAGLFLTGRPQITTKVEDNFPEEVGMVRIERTLDDIGIYIEDEIGPRVR